MAEGKSAKIERFASRYPRLYHMAEADSWPSIQRRGLLSTKALLDLFEYNGQSRHEIESMHRPRSVVIKNCEHSQAIIRDQKPMKPDHLQKVLVGMTVQQWYELLNNKCFFWVKKDRLMRFLKAYQDRPRIVITVDARALLESHWDNVTFSWINSGAIMPAWAKRGLNTFKDIGTYTRGGKAIVELAVENSVPDVAELAICVSKWKGEKHLCTIWKR